VKRRAGRDIPSRVPNILVCGLSLKRKGALIVYIPGTQAALSPRLANRRKAQPINGININIQQLTSR